MVPMRPSSHVGVVALIYTYYMDQLPRNVTLPLSNGNAGFYFTLNHRAQFSGGVSAGPIVSTVKWYVLGPTDVVGLGLPSGFWGILYMLQDALVSTELHAMKPWPVLSTTQNLDVQTAGASALGIPTMHLSKLMFEVSL